MTIFRAPPRSVHRAGLNGVVRLGAVVCTWAFLAACSKPYSGLDNTKWVELDRGIELDVGRNGSVEVSNRIKGETAEWTYDVSPDDPTRLVFKNEQGKPVFTADISRLDADDAAAHFDAAAFGQQLRFVTASAENRKKLEEKVALAMEQAKKSSIDGAPRDPSRYVDVIAVLGPQWATYYALSQDPTLADDEKRLGLLSEKWNSTSDSFERHAMKDVELRVIERKIAQAKALQYVSLPFGGLGFTPAPGVILNSLDDGQYDFDRKAFPLLGDLCRSGSSYANANGVTVYASDKVGAEICFLPVPDASIARQIESLRIAGGRSLRGRGLFKLGAAEGQRVTLLPVGAHLEVGDFGYDAGREPAPLYTTVVWGRERKPASG